MIPFAPKALRTLSQKILHQVLPELSSAYVMGDTAMLAMLVNAVAGEADNGVSMRLMDLSEIQEIFQQARSAGVDVSVAEFRLADLAAPDFTLDRLNARHDEMTFKLIELHQLVEDDPALTELNREIWSYLARHHDRHQLTI